jgi:pimeloyl-ACP methyl ester carboxylesterase
LEIEQLIAIAPPSRLDSVGDRFAEMTGFSFPVVEKMRQRICQRFDFNWNELEPLGLAPRMSVPLFVIHDHGDREIPWQESAKLAQAWPDATVEFTRGLGHQRVLRDPDVVTKVAAFIVNSDQKQGSEGLKTASVDSPAVSAFPINAESPRDRMRRTS